MQAIQKLVDKNPLVPRLPPYEKPVRRLLSQVSSLPYLEQPKKKTFSRSTTTNLIPVVQGVNTLHSNPSNIPEAKSILKKPKRQLSSVAMSKISETPFTPARSVVSRNEINSAKPAKRKKEVPLPPAILNNIMAVSNAKRKAEARKDTTKSVRFGTMTILKTMGFSYEKNKFTFASKKSLIDDTDKLKLKWKSIRTLLQKYRSIFCINLNV